jgi:hypothetical protein
VLNCFGDLGRSLVSFEAEFLALGRYRIHVPLGTPERLSRLQGALECVWATTWQHHAYVELGAALGLTRAWPVLEFGHDGHEREAKLPALAEHARGRAAAWIDDELGDAARAWASEREAQGLATLLVATEANVGLTEQQTARLERWAGSPA